MSNRLPQLDRYEAVRELGRGSMGVVYEAVHKETGEHVALKVLKSDICEHPMAQERFRREVEAAKRIAHEGIPGFRDSGELSDGRFYLAMELLEGWDFEAWWDNQKPTRAEAMDRVLEALEPLAAAHTIGIVHRDLKPGNLFLAKGPDGSVVKLLDFGIVRDLEGGGARTATGVSMGTPAYMSPEQVSKPKTVGAPADVWAIGVIMYECLSGRWPYDGETPHAMLIAVATTSHAPLADREPTLHPRLVALVERCLDRDPAKRPQNAMELRDALAPLLSDAKVRATLEGTAAHPSPQTSAFAATRAAIPAQAVGSDATIAEPVPPLWRRAWVLVAAFVLVVGGVFGWVLRPSDEEIEVAAPPPSVAVSEQQVEGAGVPSVESEVEPVVEDTVVVDEVEAIVEAEPQPELGVREESVRRARHRARRRPRPAAMAVMEEAITEPAMVAEPVRTPLVTPMVRVVTTTMSTRITMSSSMSTMSSSMSTMRRDPGFVSF